MVSDTSRVGAPICATVFRVGRMARAPSLPAFVRRYTAVCDLDDGSLAVVDGRLAVVLAAAPDLEGARRAIAEISGKGYLCALGVPLAPGEGAEAVPRLRALSAAVGCPVLASLSPSSLGDVAEVVGSFAWQGWVPKDPARVPGWERTPEPAAALVGAPAVVRGLPGIGVPRAVLLSVGVEEGDRRAREGAIEAARSTLPRDWSVIVSDHRAGANAGRTLAAAFIDHTVG